ncbi:hypothetical protein BN903_3 [Halorubrum sp. AJ67]|nr:hypothetical protein BN903_3 [Halorubrum sp. AJ67]
MTFMRGGSLRVTSFFCWSVHASRSDAPDERRVNIAVPTSRSAVPAQ